MVSLFITNNTEQVKTWKKTHFLKNSVKSKKDMRR